MDKFEKHFTMLKKNQEIFEQYKKTESQGITISDIRESKMKKHTKTDTEIAKTDIYLFFRVKKDIIKKERALPFLENKY